MVSSILLLFGAAIAYTLFTLISNLRKNIAAAKRTGLPYYVIPFSPFSLPARLLGGKWVALFKLLPRKYWEDVELVLGSNWHYEQNHKAFSRTGDTFILVSPKKILLITDDAEVIHQVTLKREAFPKPLQSYGLLSIYGDNVVTTEGAVWRMHRKITSPSFNEKNAALVFKESISQTKRLINEWLGPDGLGNKTIKSLEHDTMSLMLNIIGYVGFGLRFLSPGQALPPGTDAKLAKYASLDAAEGHTMSFVDSLASTLDHILVLLIFPKWLLNILPWQYAKKAAESENNFLTYMYEFLHDKIEDIRSGNAEEGMDIMGQLVRTSYGDKPAPGSSKKEPLALTDKQIVGNAFIMILAGHETTANIVHFAIAYLATSPSTQRKLQRDIDAILGGQEPETWDYETTGALQASAVGACINETLRLMPPVCGIPKEVSPGQDQVLAINGEKHLIPRGTQIDLVVSASQRNPRYWPTRPSRVTPGAATDDDDDDDDDMDDFVPERWFLPQTQTDTTTTTTTTTTTGTGTGTGAGAEKEVEGADTEDFGGFAGPDTSAQLYRPPRGAFAPFSDGARSCLGRRIALVELLGSLSVVFQKYSVELAVDEWASDEEVAAMGRAERAEVYKKAQDKARETIRSASTRITLKLRGDKHIPVRLVKRGEERFVGWVDADV